MSKKGISRRTLFGSTALMAGANLLIPSAAAQVVPNSCAPLPTKWDFEADVVVIGAGACGMAAAIRAADFGAEVLVVDTNYRCRRSCHSLSWLYCIGRRNGFTEEIRYSG